MMKTVFPSTTIGYLLEINIDRNDESALQLCATVALQLSAQYISDSECIHPVCITPRYIKHPLD